MPSIKDLRKRILTVRNTQQTTKAMKMVSAAKLRKAQEAILSHRVYADRLQALLREVGSFLAHRGIISTPLVHFHSASPEPKKKKILCVVFTSDRGLCGAFNQSVVKYCQRWIEDIKSQNHLIELCFVGKKGWEFFSRKKQAVRLGDFYSDFSGKVSSKKSAQLAQKLVQKFLSKEFDEIYLGYNQFQNAVVQKPRVDLFLPFVLSSEAVSIQSKPKFLWEPSPEAVFEQLVESHFLVHLLRVFLDSQAGEHGARMSAMENATKNAGEMIKKLTLEYNKQRQAGITKELLEIISGSESQKG